MSNFRTNRWYNKPPPGTPINWQHPLASGLIGCWIFNEGGGLTAYDATGRYGNGTLSGTTGVPSWVSDGGGGITPPPGHALSFVAANTQYVQIANNASYGTLSTDWAFEIVFKLNSNRNFNGLFSKTNSNLGAPFDSFVDSTGAVKINGASQFSATLSANTWYQLLVVNSVRLNVLFKALNGGFLEKNTGTLLGTTDNSNAIRIGNRNDNATPIDGQISHARLWNPFPYLQGGAGLLDSNAQDLYLHPFDMFVAPNRYTFKAGVAAGTGGTGGIINNPIVIG